MLGLIAQAWVVAYLPGALAYRLPAGDRDQRARLEFGERLFWHVVISVVWSVGVVLVLAALDAYRFERLLAVNVVGAGLVLAVVRSRLRYGGTAVWPGPALVLPLALVILALWRFFPASEYIIGGKDPGTYFNEGIAIAQRGSLVLREDVVAAVASAQRPYWFPLSRTHDFESHRFMGFWVRDVSDGVTVGQFPHWFPASIAVGFGLDGLNGARRVVGWWAALGLLAVYFAGAKIAGRMAAFAGCVLLALQVVTVFFAKYPSTELPMQALLFAAFLALMHASAGSRFFGAVAGSLVGALLFVRIDAVLAVVAIGAALALDWVVRGRRPSAAFVMALAPWVVAAGAYYTDLMRGYFTYPFEYLRNLPPAGVASGLAAAVTGLAVTWWLARRRTAAAERAVPLVLLGSITAAAAYAYFWREASGRLAAHDADALRTMTAFYVTPAGLVMSLAGLWLTARERFWTSAPLFVTFAAFALFFFFKIKVVPEHFWMARRFLAVALPVACLMMGAAAFGPRAGGLLTFPLAVGRRIVGLLLLGAIGWQYVVRAAPVVSHVEYAGMIPHVESLAARFGNRDLVLVESRDSGFDTHVFGAPLAFIYGRQVLELPNARPDKAALRAFLGEARRRYDRVWFLGGGGTDLLSRYISAAAVHSESFSVPEYESPMNAYPSGVTRKDFHYTIYELGLDPVWTGGFTLDVGDRDDLHLVRFHAREQTEGRTVRWTGRRSTIAISGLVGSERVLRLWLHDGGRPAGAQPARVSLKWDETPLGTIDVGPGFRAYEIALPPALVAAAAEKADPVALHLESTVWSPAALLGGRDDRELGVMLDRVEIR